MRELEEKILKDGEILPGDILKVGRFLNQQVDTDLLEKMGSEVIRFFHNDKITKVLTIEASGIPFACSIAEQLKVPFIFAKKSTSVNLSGKLYTSKAYSYTHKKEFSISVTAEYLKEDDSVLIVDDFLAAGNALIALIDIVKQSKANLVGCAVEIEKSYQEGGKRIRDMGIKLLSLAKIKSMSDNAIEFEE